jgi:hypothetical protein
MLNVVMDVVHMKRHDIVGIMFIMNEARVKSIVIIQITSIRPDDT